MKILTVVGARPQFIKAASFSFNLKKYPKIQEVLIHTGQHFDKNMSEVFFSELKIPDPHYLLNSGGKSHGEMTGYQIKEIEKIILNEKPDYLMVYGDTNSTLSGALAASKLHIPIVHIEAGLRSHNMNMPEEINRILTDRLSKILFCSSNDARENLLREGYNNFDIDIHVVGDIMLDTIKLFMENLEIKKPYEEPYVMCTIHREEITNHKEKLTEIIKSINEISKSIKIIFPIHPRTKKLISDLKIVLSDNVLVTQPMSYINFLSYVKHCEIVITDSGGLQKESYFLKKNCLVIRRETEWTELIENDYNKLCGFKKEKIIENFNNRSTLNTDFSLPIYGDGNTAKKIIDIISDNFYK